MSIKDCGHHDRRRKLRRRLLAAAASLAATTLLIILIIWLILRPTKPHFTLQDSTVFDFNLTSPNLLTATLQITLSARNPNTRVGIYYDRLDVYAAYRGQQVTLATALPASYQGHDDVTVWSPSLFGASVAVAPFLAEALDQDKAAGTVMVNVRVDGRLRWKVGTFVSGEYRMYVNCPTYLYFVGNKINIGSGMKYQLSMNCIVDV